jgi:hypothetical protein
VGATSIASSEAGRTARPRRKEGNVSLWVRRRDRNLADGAHARSNGPCSARLCRRTRSGSSPAAIRQDRRPRDLLPCHGPQMQRAAAAEVQDYTDGPSRWAGSVRANLACAGPPSMQQRDKRASDRPGRRRTEQDRPGRWLLCPREKLCCCVVAGCIWVRTIYDYARSNTAQAARSSCITA